MVCVLDLKALHPMAHTNYKLPIIIFQDVCQSCVLGF